MLFTLSELEVPTSACVSLNPSSRDIVSPTSPSSLDVMYANSSSDQLGVVQPCGEPACAVICRNTLATIICLHYPHLKSGTDVSLNFGFLGIPLTVLKLGSLLTTLCSDKSRELRPSE